MKALWPYLKQSQLPFLQTGEAVRTGKNLRLSSFDRSLVKDEKRGEFCFGRFHSALIHKAPVEQRPIKDSIMRIKLTDKISQTRRQRPRRGFYLTGSVHR